MLLLPGQIISSLSLLFCLGRLHFVPGEKFIHIPFLSKNGLKAVSYVSRFGLQKVLSCKHAFGLEFRRDFRLRYRPMSHCQGIASMSTQGNNSQNFMPLAKQIAVDIKNLKATVDGLGMANSIAEAHLHMELLRLQLNIITQSTESRMRHLLQEQSSVGGS